jgi:hypothetical protein
MYLPQKTKYGLLWILFSLTFQGNIIEKRIEE